MAKKVKRDLAREVWFFHYVRRNHVKLMKGRVVGNPKDSGSVSVQTQEGPSKLVRLHDVTITSLHPTKRAALQARVEEAESSLAYHVKQSRTSARQHEKQIRLAQRNLVRARLTFDRELKKQRRGGMS